MDDIERLEQEGRSALAQAATSDELELARVAVLGRSAPVTLALRGVATLEPSERGPRGAALNGVRKRLEAEHAARAEALSSGELERRLREDAIDVTASRCAGAARRRTPALADPAGDRGRLHRARLPHRGGPGGRARVLQLHGAEHAGRPSRRRPSRTRSGSTRASCLRTHTSPVQVRTMESQPPPVYVIVPGRVYRRDALDATHSPQFQQVEGIAVDRGLTLGDLKGTLQHFARELFGPEREVLMGSDFFPFTEPSVQLSVSCFLCDGRGCRTVQGLGLDRDPGRGHGRPERVRLRRRATTPRSGRASRSAWASSASRCCATASITCAASTTTTCASSSSSREGSDEGPARMAPGSPGRPAARRSPSCARASRSQASRSRRSRAAACPSRTGSRSSSWPASCSRPTRTRTRTACSSARSIPAARSRVRSCAAPGTSAPATPSPWRRPACACPTGARSSAPSCAARSRTA